MTTTWKERGIVPDSDEEDDALDSQTTWNSEEHGDRDSTSNLHLALLQQGTEAPVLHEQALSLQENSGQQSNCSGASLLAQEPVAGDLLSEGRPGTQIQHGTAPDQLANFEPKNVLQPPSSPVLSTVTQSNLSLGAPGEEEISRSYVGLSSPTSSISSLSSSLFATPRQSPRRASILPLDDDELPGSSNAVPCPPFDDVTEQEMSILNDARNYGSINRRSFRPRTQIQLHPYLLDSERHRKEFMARGLRPMRFIPAQQMAQNSSQNGDSQDAEFETEEDSQKTDNNDGDGVFGTSQTLPSSPVPSRGTALEIDDDMQLASSSQVSVRVDADGDEFPDIGDLVNQARKGEFRARRTNNVEDRRARGKGRSRPWGSQHASSSSANRPPQISDIFDVPQSPPLTSSPPILAGDMEGANSGNRSDTTVGSADSRGNMDHGQVAANLPTPAMSSAKRIDEHSGEMFVIDDDPFTSSDEEGEPQSVTPKGPSGIRKLLRGVLPASHIRINAQTGGLRQTAPRATDRNNFNHSQPLPEVRRGLALPRVADGMSVSGSADLRTGLSFLSDESDEDDFGSQGIVKESGGDSQPLMSQSDFGFATEDNRIDPMIIPRKRQRSLFSTVGSKKKRRVASSLLDPTHDRPSYQPRITELLSDLPRTPVSTQRAAVERRNVQSLAQKVSAKIKSRSRPSQRSIQEVMPDFSEPVASQPMFIRIAARSAGSRHSLGRHGPTRKFVRLDNRDDTIEAQTVLREWRKKPVRVRPPTPSSRSPLRVMSLDSGNQMRFSSNKPQTPVKTHTTIKRESSTPRAVVSNHQMKISWPSTNPEMDSHVGLGNGNLRRTSSKKRTRNLRHPRALHTMPQLRSAQLEVSEADYNNRDNRSAFGSTKRNLDRSYKLDQNGFATGSHMPLNRFLANEGLASNKTDTSKPQTIERDGGREINITQKGIPQTHRQRKRTPKQMDATAARFRQPDKPVIIAPVEPPTPGVIQDPGGKLYGLGGSDSHYPIDFDVFPLRSGVYFHESTFIGQGKLGKAIGTNSSWHFDHPRGYASAKFGTQYVKWGIWDATVSSEIGTYFDWIVSQLNLFGTASLNAVNSDLDGDTVQCMLFMIEYFQDTLTFKTHDDLDLCLSRMSEVLERLTQCLEVLASSLDTRDDINSRRIMDLSVFEVIIIFQALRMSTTHDGNAGKYSSQLEALLQRAAITSVKLLFIVGLSSVQNLYDELQYLASREAGIRSSETPTQAWVLLMHIMHAARIPRVSFWDAVNLQLLENINIESDARVLEKKWYSAFSLLPLMEFDELGVLVTRSRYRKTWENWVLPQKIAKRLFELYATDANQPPNFNIYCRATFSRCHHLIQVWGWRRYGSIVGTFFDFFASNGFSHLGGEVLYASPEFIEDLDGALSSAIESEDQCFHIFLKIVHSAIKQLRDAGESREIKNLVTRLLPNHDLEYQEGPTKATNMASLRNHRDLLSTLYWAAPPELQNKISMMLKLVNQERSKREAYLKTPWRG